MSYMKRYFEDHINDFSDEQLREWGYSDEEIAELREAFAEE